MALTLGPRCSTCVLHKLSKGYAVTDGTGSNKVLIVAEALGEVEAITGLPLVGPTGKQLNRMIERTPVPGPPLSRDQFLLTNIIRCQPPGNILTGAKYEESAIAHCAPYLEDLIREFKPKCILALGNQPLRWFTGQWGIDGLRGYVFDTKYGPVIGSYHPAYILRGKFSLARVFQMDLRKALYVAQHGAPKADKHYILHPSPMDVEAYADEYEKALKADPDLVLAFDIETAYKSMKKDEAIEVSIEDDESYTIRRISFSFKEFTAITFPWIPPYISTARRMLGSPGPTTAWNGLNFDIPRLEANGCPVVGKHMDAMNMWHFLEPSLPMGLKFVGTFYCPELGAWKLDSHSRPEMYSATDSDVLLRCFNGIKKQLVEEGRWDIFDRHFIQLEQLLRKMSLRGVRVDTEKRDVARVDFERRRDELVTKLQSDIPEPCRPIEKVYKQDEAWLRKGGKWEEGRMKLLPVEISQEEHEKMVLKAQKKLERLMKVGTRKKRSPKLKSTPLATPVIAGETENLS